MFGRAVRINFLAALILFNQQMENKGGKYMSLIKVENLTFSYPSGYENVFNNVNIQIDSDWKLGFIGRNGKGKTTFFHLLLGKYEYGGKIISNVQFNYFPYHIDNKNQITIDILNQICPIAEEWELIKELSSLDVEADILWKNFSILSNGEQTKVLLAALFLNENHFLLIDEPTNHLDMESRKIVSKYLKKKKGFILVSHDRQFLDECIDHILSLNRTNIEIQKGNYSTWITNFERQQEFEKNQNKHLQQDIKRLNNAARQSSAWSAKVEKSKIGAADKGYVGHKSAKMMKRAKNIENRQAKAIEQKSKLLNNIETAEPLKISALDYHTDKLADFTNIEIKYENKVINRPVSFKIKRGDRIAIDGKNGCGKSSLLKILSGEQIAYTGTVNIGSGLKISYLPQDTSYLQGELSEFIYTNRIDETLFKAVLQKMDFSQTHLKNDIKNLSDGQKKKLLIAKSICEKSHLYVWDEPLNFLDIYSRIQLEQMIEEYAPTMIFVEHDSVFRNKIATDTIMLEKKTTDD